MSDYFFVYSQLNTIIYVVCRELGFLGWWVTSAKTGESLDEAFNILVRKIIMVTLILLCLY